MEKGRKRNERNGKREKSRRKERIQKGKRKIGDIKRKRFKCNKKER